MLAPRGIVVSLAEIFFGHPANVPRVLLSADLVGDAHLFVVDGSIDDDEGLGLPAGAVTRGPVC